MKIAGSAVNLASTHEKAEYREVNESLRITNPNAVTSQLRLNPPTQNPGNTTRNLIGNASRPPEDIETPLSSKDSLALRIAEILLQQATGKKIKLNVKSGKNNTGQQQIRTVNTNLPQIQGPVIDYHRQETHVEIERTHFQAYGKIYTTDGRQIDFNAELAMSREFIQHHDIRIVIGEQRAVDPLVVNYAGVPPTLTEAKFAFDLDSDGTMDMISFVGPGSGFLAIDRNGNGTIDNGTELFGPNTGNGFHELAAYDHDGNSWIDEADAVFDQLRIWVKDEAGEDRLFTLKEKNIGAIYLDHIGAKFTFKDSANQDQGYAQSAGIFLSENGTAGIIQQIDLAV